MSIEDVGSILDRLKVAVIENKKLKSQLEKQRKMLLTLSILMVKHEAP